MELSFLRPVCARPGPWASVYLDASRDTETSRPELDLRWRALAGELAEQGAPRATIDALDDAVRRHSPLPGDYGLAAFATDGRVILAEYLSAPPRRDLATYAPLAHTMPLLAQRGEQIPWVRVLASRTAARLDAISAGGVSRRAHVRGAEEFPIRKVQPGGWSQSRYQREAQEAWQRNAGGIAAATVDLAERIGAEVIVVAGDERARPLVVTQLPRRWQDRVVFADAGQLAAGANQSALDDETAQAVAEVAARHTEEALDRYAVQPGVGNGLEAVVSALQRGQVDTMLLVDDPSSTEQLWIGPEPTDIALDPAELAAMAVDRPQRVRADAALVRALAGTEAGLTLVGPDDTELDGGVGAVLRYVDTGTGGAR
jgi:hypothetical protein